MTTTQTAIELDETDRAVLAARVRDARAGPREIAAETGLPANRVDDSLTRLEAAGAIDGYTARVDYDRLGFDVTALLWLSVTDDGLAHRLGGMPGIVTVYEVTGDHDVFAVGRFPDTDAMNASVAALLTDEGVETARASVALGAAREFVPPEVVEE